MLKPVSSEFVFYTAPLLQDAPTRTNPTTQTNAPNKMSDSDASKLQRRFYLADADLLRLLLDSNLSVSSESSALLPLYVHLQMTVTSRSIPREEAQVCYLQICRWRMPVWEVVGRTLALPSDVDCKPKSKPQHRRTQSESKSQSANAAASASVSASSRAALSRSALLSIDKLCAYERHRPILLRIMRPGRVECFEHDYCVGELVSSVDRLLQSQRVPLFFQRAGTFTKTSEDALGRVHLNLQGDADADHSVPASLEWVRKLERNSEDSPELSPAPRQDFSVDDVGPTTTTDVETKRKTHTRRNSAPLWSTALHGGMAGSLRVQRARFFVDRTKPMLHSLAPRLSISVLDGKDATTTVERTSENDLVELCVSVDQLVRAKMRTSWIGKSVLSTKTLKGNVYLEWQCRIASAETTEHKEADAGWRTVFRTRPSSYGQIPALVLSMQEICHGNPKQLIRVVCFDALRHHRCVGSVELSLHDMLHRAKERKSAGLILQVGSDKLVTGHLHLRRARVLTRADEYEPVSRFPSRRRSAICHSRSASISLAETVNASPSSACWHSEICPSPLRPLRTGAFTNGNSRPLMILPDTIQHLQIAPPDSCVL